MCRDDRRARYPRPAQLLRFLKPSYCACVKISPSVWGILGDENGLTYASGGRVTKKLLYVYTAGPLEAIFVIFARRALIFFVWKLLENIKNDTTFVRMRSGDYLGDGKKSKKGTSLLRI